MSHNYYIRQQKYKRTLDQTQQHVSATVWFIQATEQTINSHKHTLLTFLYTKQNNLVLQCTVVFVKSLVSLFQNNIK